jgi:adenylate kinase
VDINVPEDELVRRLAGRRICVNCGANAGPDDEAACARCGGAFVQRNDDGEGIVRERLKVYRRETRPLVEYYRASPTFRTINGNQPPERVAGDLRTAVDSAGAEATL